MVASVVLVLACDSSNRQSNSASTNSPVAQPASSDKTLPTATEIGEVLKAEGIPFTYDVTDTTGALAFLKGPDVGIVSEAKTATATMDVDITVFRSIDSRRQARARLDTMNAKLHADEARGFGALPSIEYYAECGTIMVIFQPDFKARKLANAQATKAQAILQKHYKCD
jgi:hypothetical protein